MNKDSTKWGIDFKRQMEEMETVMAELAIALASYRASLIKNGIPASLADTLVIMMQDAALGTHKK